MGLCGAVYWCGSAMPLSGAGYDCRFRAALLTPASLYERREATPIVLARLSCRGAEQPPGDNIALPMFPTFQAGDGVVDWQRFECPDPWIVFGVIDDQGCDEAHLQRHLASRKAVTAAALKP